MSGRVHHGCSASSRNRMPARLEIHIRRPPCRFCSKGRMWSSAFSDTQVICRKCRGQAGIVEYSMFLSTDHGVQCRWLEWPGEEQQILLRDLANWLPE